MANEHTTPTSDNDFARWLVGRMADQRIAGYRPLEAALARRGLHVGASQLWGYVHGDVLPTRRVCDRLAAFFGWDPAEVWRLRVRAQHAAEAAEAGHAAGVPRGPPTAFAVSLPGARAALDMTDPADAALFFGLGEVVARGLSQADRDRILAVIAEIDADNAARREGLGAAGRTPGGRDADGVVD